jgi:Gram-negative bacterial TonB protein C-terminal
MGALLDAEAAVVELRQPPLPLPSLTLREIGYGHRPGRGLGLSVFSHLLALGAILFLGRYGFFRPAIVVTPQFEPNNSANILVLPTLGGGSEGSGRSGGGKGSADKASSELRSRSQRGFAYPGPQPLVSNPKGATLGIQTILQPSIENLPRSKNLLPLPNIVEPPTAASDLGHAKAALVVKPQQVTVRPADTQIAAPKLTLPVAANNKIVNLVETKPELPQRAAPDPVDASEVPGVKNGQQGLLVLNAVPPPPEVSGKIPRLEARALFAVAPGEATIIAAPGAGTKGGGLPAMEAGSGNPEDNPSGDTLAGIAGGGDGTSPGGTGSGTGSGGRSGNGQGSGVNSDSSTAGTGRGAGSGPGVGTGSGAGRGSGSGAGSAPGTGGFPGITIQGGRYGNGGAGSILAKTQPHGQHSYSLNVVSTGSSGGGLPDFGVFENEKVYTVYLDMRANDEDPAPSWTLQYAVLQPPADASGGHAGRIQGTPTPPYALVKQVPEFTPELLRASERKLIVASGVIDASGKVDQVSVKQGSDSQLIGPLLEALKHWMFEPAQIDGKPVALKILLGIRLGTTR